MKMRQRKPQIIQPSINLSYNPNILFRLMLSPHILHKHLLKH